MRERTRLRTCAAVLSLVAGLSVPAQVFAQGGYGPTSTPTPPQNQTPAPKPPRQPEPARAEARPPRPNPALMAFDLLIVRPLALVAAAVGAVLFLPVALITAPMGRDGIQAAKETFVTVPSNAAFKRPLGEF